ncbi:MAG TPA: right-handed parallel beta-helix repeat-containing protein, partial [Candidatus Ozemobacteraceae bacterium]|nr:right-handed parallel beta-helix repeat-containing protein [Candidatus Ozemobacteraceae bacterium]
SDAGADFAGFAVYKSAAAQGPFNRFGTLTNQNAYIDNDVLAGVKYYYRVTRLSGSGDESSPSNVEAFVMPGVMSTNAVWTSQESPYYLTGDLTIAANASLIIDKGVTVAIAKGDQWDADSVDDLIDISVQGTLMVQGTSLQPVTMTSSAASPQPGDWNGITFENVSDLGASLLKGLRLSYAQNGVNGVAGLPEVKESSFNSCRQAAVKMTSARRDQTFRSLTIETCGSGIDLQNNQVKVQILDCRISRCINSIICLGNKLAEIERNRIILSGACGIDLGNTETASKARYNIIGHGSGGIGIICRGKDEVRRNTVHANVGIEIKETAQAVVRSNLVLADNSRNGVGIMYSGTVPYNPSTATNTQYIQNNGIWNVTGNRKYANSDGTSLSGYSADLNFTELAGPGLQGGDPFASQLNEDFNYKPSSGSPVKGAGYDYETIGAEDVPD